MGIIIKYISTLFEREKWRSIFSTKTQTTKPACTSSRNLLKHQIHSSWMSNAHNAILSTQSSQTLKKYAFAPTANTSLPFQEVERPSSLSALPGEERETELNILKFSR